MIKIENVVLPSPEQWEAVIRGMRNPKNSWDRSDSYTTYITNHETENSAEFEFFLGEKDETLMNQLAAGGPVHAKYRRMIPFYLDITRPLYWWKEMDTYKIGTVANSCSTMHKVHAKEFELDDFSNEHLMDGRDVGAGWLASSKFGHPDVIPYEILKSTVKCLNAYRDAYLFRDKQLKDETLDKETREAYKADRKKYWWQMIQLLPSSYNQKRTVMLNYEVLVNIYNSRRGHKLDEWHDFCIWIESLPYAELIIGKDEIKTDDYKVRFVKEYKELKEKFGKLHELIAKYDAGTLDFELNCPIDLLRDQRATMGHYMRVLEARGEFEGIDLRKVV